MARIILFTGKGGVGKTSLAAATALRCAEQGLRTVVVSTDAAHSLADSLEHPLGPEPTEVVANLWGQEIDLLYQMEKYWGAVEGYLSAFFSWRGMDDLIAEEASVLPGMEELASLLQIVKLHNDGEYDVIVIDAAPTGETLKLLSFPEMARWYLEKIFPIEKRAVQLSRPLLRSITDLPIPEDQLFDVIESLILDLNRMHDLLADPEMSSVRLVLNPEKMVIKEAQRTYTYLNLYGYPVDAVISNRLIPEAVHDVYFEKWKAIQEKYGRVIEEAFSPLPILTVPLMDSEVVGLERLRQMGQLVYGDLDAAAVLFKGSRHYVRKEEGCYVLGLKLPFVSKEQLQLTRSGDELIVHIGNQKRNIVLPRVLVGLEVKSAKVEDGEVRIVFVAAEEAAD